MSSHLIPPPSPPRRSMIIKDLSSPIIPQRQLPQELVDHIIDHLYDDPATLTHCSLVCNTWLPTSRLHLFSKISLKATPAYAITPAELCKRLHTLLMSSPSIISCIRELEVLEGSPLGGAGASAPQAAAAAAVAVAGVIGNNRSTTWIATERTFPHLLRQLTHLRRLEFGAQSTALHWDLLPPSLQSAIHHVFSLPSLTFVRLKSWTFTDFGDLAGLLACCRNLQGLALACVCVTGEPGSSGFLDFPSTTTTTTTTATTTTTSTTSSSAVSDDDDPVTILTNVKSSSSRCLLEFLTIEYVDFGSLGHWLMSPHSTVDLCGLRELRVAHFDDLPAVKRLLARTGNSLEHFHFKTGILDVYPFDLSINPNLRSIKLTLEDPFSALHWVKTLLNSLSSTATTTTTTTGTLEHISLEFFTDLKQMPIDGWTELDSLFSRPELSLSLSGLRQVEIGLFALMQSVEFLKVEEELVGLRERGVLRMYRLGLKNQRSNQQLMPRISRYES